MNQSGAESLVSRCKHLPEVSGVISVLTLEILVKEFITTTHVYEGRPVVVKTGLQLSEQIGGSQSAASRAIQKLEKAGLVQVRRSRKDRAPINYYSVPLATYLKLGVTPPSNCAYYSTGAA